LAWLDGKPLEDGLPKQLVKTSGWDNWTDEDVEDLRIIDFGEAFVQGAEPAELAQPDVLRAPETIFTGNFDFRLDLWRAGIVVRRCSFVSKNNEFIFNLDRFIRAWWEDFHSTTGAIWMLWLHR